MLFCRCVPGVLPVFSFQAILPCLHCALCSGLFLKFYSRFPSLILFFSFMFLLVILSDIPEFLRTSQPFLTFLKIWRQKRIKFQTSDQINPTSPNIVEMPLIFKCLCATSSSKLTCLNILHWSILRLLFEWLSIQKRTQVLHGVTACMSLAGVNMYELSWFLCTDCREG